MHWLKTWLMKWLGIDEVRAENAELILRLDAVEARISKLSNSVDGYSMAICGTSERLDAISNAISNGIKRDLIDIVKIVDRDRGRIYELEALVKDATLDTALAALEGRVSRIEATPPPAPGPQGRRGGSSWATHQLAATAGAAFANGVDIPIPTPGVS